jgi:hypothetical protein
MFADASAFRETMPNHSAKSRRIQNLDALFDVAYREDADFQSLSWATESQMETKSVFRLSTTDRTLGLRADLTLVSAVCNLIRVCAST